jgi:hypothetical protein
MAVDFTYIGRVKLRRNICRGAAVGTAVVAVTIWNLAVGSPALAQGGGKARSKTPENFAYELVNGQRVPRGKRVTNADGSWREEIRNGACMTVKEQNAAGEYRETRKCD